MACIWLVILAVFKSMLLHIQINIRHTRFVSLSVSSFDSVLLPLFVRFGMYGHAQLHTNKFDIEENRISQKIDFSLIRATANRNQQQQQQQ